MLELLTTNQKVTHIITELLDKSITISIPESYQEFIVIKNNITYLYLYSKFELRYYSVGIDNEYETIDILRVSDSKIKQIEHLLVNIKELVFSFHFETLKVNHYLSGVLDFLFNGCEEDGEFKFIKKGEFQNICKPLIIKLNQIND